jgi:prepilin-type N-terminal cleavage/methylation domain-containing protein
MHKNIFGKGGFTLIELIVSLLLISIFVSIAGMGLVQIGQGYVFARQNVETIQKTQIAMTRIAKELSMVTPGTATTINSVTPPYTAATSINYTRPASASDSTSVTNIIALSGSTVQINGATLLDNVQSFSLNCTQSDSVTPATSAANIWFIVISITVVGADNQPLTFANSVSIRESYL